MSLSNPEMNELWALRDALKKDYKERDTKWEWRRRIRYRRMHEDLQKLPLSPLVSEHALLVHQSELPNQEAHKRTKRLVANPPRFEIVILESDPELRGIGQELENGVKALFRWMNRGKVSFDWQVTEFQQGDGAGLGKVEFIPGHGVSLRHFKVDDLLEDDEEADEGSVLGEEADGRNKARAIFREELASDDDLDEQAAFDRATDKALRTELPPYRLIAVDPLTCAWWEDGDGISVIAEYGKKRLNPLLAAFKEHKLKLVENRLIIEKDGSEAISSTTIPESYPSQGGQEVEYTEIRTREMIYILIEHPVIDKRTTNRPKDSTRGIVLSFENPFGPYTTGYAVVAGDVTTEEAPEDKYQPPILGVLATTQAENVLMTARLSGAIDSALSPAYQSVKEDQPLPPDDEDKVLTTESATEIPVVQGEIKRVPSPTNDLKDVEGRIAAELGEFKMTESVLGDATSDTSGHRLAIQVAQADIQLTPYQNNRAHAMTELLKGIIYSVRKHGLPIFIPTLPEKRRTGKQIAVSEPAKITPEMADLPFELVVTLGAETPVTKFAKWQALQDREAKGTLGYQTVIEESDVEDPDEEIARVFEGKMLKATMEEILPRLSELMMQMVEQKLQAYTQAQAEAQAQEAGMVNPNAQAELETEVPASGTAGGGGRQADISQLIRLPGVNRQVVETTDDFGPRSPETTGAAVGRSI